MVPASTCSSTRYIDTAFELLKLNVTAYSIPFHIPGSQSDRLILHYFCVYGAPELSGYGAMGLPFWNDTLLRLSHDSAVVRQAVIALSCAHLSFSTSALESDSEAKRDWTKQHEAEALQQYNKAVGRLRRHLADEQQYSAKVALVCCVIFHCFENACGNFDTALTHLRNGLAIWKRTPGVPERTTGDADMCSLTYVSVSYTHLTLPTKRIV